MRKEPELKDNQIRKHYSLGDHVKVLFGQHEGSTGLIVKVDDATNTVVLFSDTTQQEVGSVRQLLFISVKSFVMVRWSLIS